MLYILGFTSITHKQSNLQIIYTVMLNSKHNSYVTFKGIFTPNHVDKYFF